MSAYLNVSVAVLTPMIDALRDDVTIQGYLGNPARVYARIARETAFPFARADVVSVSTNGGILGSKASGGGGRWVYDANVQVAVFTQSPSSTSAGTIIGAIDEVFNDTSGWSGLAYSFIGSYPIGHELFMDPAVPDGQGWCGITNWKLKLRNV